MVATGFSQLFFFDRLARPLLAFEFLPLSALESSRLQGSCRAISFPSGSSSGRGAILILILIFARLKVDERRIAVAWDWEISLSYLHRQYSEPLLRGCTLKGYIWFQDNPNHAHSQMISFIKPASRVIQLLATSRHRTGWPPFTWTMGQRNYFTLHRGYGRMKTVIVDSFSRKRCTLAAMINQRPGCDHVF